MHSVLSDGFSPDEVAPPTDGGRKDRAKGRKTLIAAVVVATVLVVAAGVGLLVWRLHNNAAINYQAKPTNVKARSSQEEQAANQTGAQTQVIKEARTIFGNPSNAGVNSATTTATTATTAEAAKDKTGVEASTTARTSPPPIYDIDPGTTPMTIPNGISGTVTTGANTAGTNNRSGVKETIGAKEAPKAATHSEVGDAATATAADAQTTKVKSQRNPERSIHLAEPDNAINQSSQIAANNAQPKSQPRANNARETRSFAETVKPIALPTFGTTLPVRTLGALYTLRNGSLARFELTRDVEGQGWGMKRGTVLVGVGKGGEYDRAYVNVVGFIDPESNKLVRMSGDVLGSDGGSGLKGKRRSLDGGWQKFLGSIAPSAINAAGLMLSGLGKQNVVVADAFGYRLVNPISSEISGMARHYGDRRSQRGFVEVAAGAPGYILVNNLPKEIKGIDAVGEMDAEELESSSDSTLPRASTGLSEQELAELLSTGSPDEIREALPRMTPQMRRIAEGFLAQQEEK